VLLNDLFATLHGSATLGKSVTFFRVYDDSTYAYLLVLISCGYLYVIVYTKNSYMYLSQN
jgi:hypothetical protein